MNYRSLGRTGVRVSPYAPGTLMFATTTGNPDPDDSLRIIHKALDAALRAARGGRGRQEVGALCGLKR
jgi:aryl-alcohol dehydrogenase-like predicted oxidoreductase